MTIDSDIHFWKYNKGLQSPLIRSEKKMQEDLLPPAVQLNLQRNGLQACVAVAAEPTEVETRFLAELMRTHPLIRGVIGWIDLTRADAVEKLDELAAAYPEIRGYKFRVSSAGLSDTVMTALAAHQYTLDLELAPGADSGALKTWADAWPEQIFILSQCGSPDPTKPPADSWTSAMNTLASCPNISCKISGLFTLASWNKWRPADFYPFLETLFSVFGYRRLLYGSDWPFMLLSGSYVQWKSMLDKFTGHLGEDERAEFYGDNASRLYLL